MNKEILIILLLLFTLKFAAQTTPISDTNFEQDLINQGFDTNGLNGTILDTDAQAITAYTAGRNDITDFSGLEAFVNLTVLNAAQNQVPTIPLTTLTLLEELRFERNTALTNLDLTQNLALRILRFNNDTAPPIITDLDLSQNVNLEDLNIRTVRSLTSLTLPATATLTDIYVANMSVPTIDLSELTGDLNFRIVGSDVFVTIIYPNLRTALKQLELSSINFATVDVSEMIGLERFGLSSTNTQEITLPATSTLTNISISGHELQPTTSFAMAPELTNLRITNKRDAVPLVIDISQNLELTNLNLNRNRMVDVDVSQNTKLTNFDINTNDLTTIDISQNLDLTDLNVSSNQLPTLDVSLNTELTRLTASNNLLPTIDLSTNLELRYLYLGENQLPDLDITNNGALWILAINNNLFTGSGLDLSQNTELFIMNISNNQVETLDFSNTAMRNLDISYNIFPGNQVLNDFYAKIEPRGHLSDVVLRANNNLLTGRIPDFYSIYTDNDPSTVQHRRWWLHIENNFFHFGDFENEHLGYISLLTTQSIGPSPDVVMREYTYAPQEKVNAIENPNRNAGESITLITTVRGTQNHYKWFKDGVEIPDAPDAPELILTNINTCDAGIYHSEITSDLVPFENSNPPSTSGKNLLLVRNDITLTVNATKDCVALSNPANGATNVPINTGIEWDDNPGACGYKISVGTTSGGTDIVNDEDVGEVTVYNFASDLDPNQQYFVTITPYFDDGDFGGCSEQSFTTNTTTVAPECTVLLSPANGAIDVRNDLPNINWNPANGATEYRVSVTGSSSTANNITNQNITGTSYNFSNDFDNGETVTVTIIPFNAVGDAVGCTSESFTIVTATPTLPACTNLNRPFDGDTGVDTNITLRWDVVINATGYFITVVNTSTGVTIVNEEDTRSNPLYNFEPPLNENTTYEVTITPYNAAGSATGCATESFSTSNPTSVPTCTNLSSPLDNDIDIATDIEISWNTVTDATGYRISISSTSGNNNITNFDNGNNTTYNPPADFDSNDLVTVTIIPFNAVGDAVGCTSESFTIASAIPTVPSSCTNLASPSNGTTDVAVDLASISWDAVSDATEYRVSVARSSSTANNITNQNITGTSYNFSNNFDNGETVTVTIIPFNAVGDAVGCTSESFTIASAIPTVPSSCTNLASPSNGTTDVAVDLASISWDAVSDATEYRVSVAGSSSTANNITNQNITGTSYNFSNDFDNGETVTVTIIPFNAVGDAVGCTSQSFTIVSAIPTVPSSCTNLASPSNGATDVAVDLASISWDAVSDATGYRVSVNGSTTNANDITNQNITGTSYNFSNDFDNGETVTVTIIPFNAVGDAVGCTSESFTIVTATPTVPSSCTNLASPSNGATDVAVDLASISWDVVTDATEYRLSVAGSSSTANNITNQNITGTSYNFSNDFDNGETVTVTIIPFNAVGDAVGCTSESFTIVTATPTVPSSCTNLASPSNGATDVVVDLASISWDAVSDATGYRVSVNGSTTNANDITNQNITGTCYNFSNDFDNGETVTVTIIPFNDVGDAVGCTSESFTIITATPTVPSSCANLVSPTNGATDINVNLSKISWDAVIDAVGYRVSINGSTSTTNNITDQIITNTFYSFANNFDNGETVTVTIIPFNDTGDAVGCAVQSFTIEEEVFSQDETKYGFSPDGDGIRDVWEIVNIENYPNNRVSIYNRWGNIVYEIKGYNNTSNVFDGTANKLTGLGANELPEGTYFFNIEIDGAHNIKKLKGFLVLKR